MEILSIEENGEINVHPYVKFVPEIKKVWTRDKTFGKSRAKLEFLFIYHMYNYKSPYSKAYNNDNRESKLIRDLFPTKAWKPDTAVKEACKKYVELYESSEIKTLRVLRESLHTASGLINSLKEVIEQNIEEKKNLADSVSHFTDIINIAKSFPSTIESLAKLEEKIRKDELTSNKRVQSNAKVNYFEI